METKRVKIPIAVTLLASVAVAGLAWWMHRPPEDDYPRKEVRINCISNMKQISIAFRLWSGDNGDAYTFNTSTNKGGTLEFCDRDRDGFERNSARHFLPMSNELNTPKVLTCPQDPSKKPAADWAGLTAANVTYRIHSGTNVDELHPNEVLFVCPIDGNTAYCDGRVEPGKAK